MKLLYFLIVFLISFSCFSNEFIPDSFPAGPSHNSYISMPLSKRKSPKHINEINPFTENMILINIDKRDKVLASASGNISITEYQDFIGDKFKIVIDHNNGFKTEYSNIELLEIDINRKSINKGDIIGSFSNKAWGRNLLYFSIYYNNEVINPELLYAQFDLDEIMKITKSFFNYEYVINNNLKKIDFNIGKSIINMNLSNEDINKIIGMPESTNEIKYSKVLTHNFDITHRVYTEIDTFTLPEEHKPYSIKVNNKDVLLLNSIKLGDDITHVLNKLGLPGYINSKNKIHSSAFKLYLLENSPLTIQNDIIAIRYNILETPMEDLTGSLYISFENGNVNNISYGIVLP